MNEGVLNFPLLLHWLHQLIEQLDDPRQPSNGTKFSLKDIVLGACAVFFMQCPSFLEHQRQVHSRHGHDNAQALFELEELPTSNQIKNILDLIAVRFLFWNGRDHEICQYRYYNRIPLREELPAGMVNWCEVFVTRAADGK